MSIVTKTIRYTQPAWFPNQVQNVVDHDVECDDTSPYPNGMPVPTANNTYDWAALFENFDSFPDHSDVTP